jgi:hypothetical protein
MRLGAAAPIRTGFESVVPQLRQLTEVAFMMPSAVGHDVHSTLFMFDGS